MFRAAFFYITLSALLGMSVAPFVVAFAPYIEGRLLPVVEDAEITRTKAISSTETMIFGEAKKLRNCKFKDIDFRFKDRPNSPGVFVRWEFIEGTKDRSGGWFDFGPWKLWLKAGDILNKTESYVYHECHPLWLTKTKFLSIDE